MQFFFITFDTSSKDSIGPWLFLAEADGEAAKRMRDNITAVVAVCFIIFIEIS